MKTEIDKREQDIQAMCVAILGFSVESTGDSGPGGMCPFCCVPCSWNASLSEIRHAPECVYLIAKDLRTGYAKD